MPSSKLSFLRPLYDIAVWQYILLLGPRSDRHRAHAEHLPMTRQMHVVVANFVCKLLEVAAFSHLKTKIEEEEVKEQTGNWNQGDMATDKLIKWCQDQWRRKKPVLPHQHYCYGAGQPWVIPLFGKETPLCHACGTPCPECRKDLERDIPSEMSTAAALLNYEEVSQMPSVASKQASEEPGPNRMALKKRKAC